MGCKKIQTSSELLREDLIAFVLEILVIPRVISTDLKALYQNHVRSLTKLRLFLDLPYHIISGNTLKKSKPMEDVGSLVWKMMRIFNQPC